MKQILISILTLSISLNSIAGIENLMKYTHPEAESNLNKPEVIKDQSGGFFTGGSLLIRSPRPKTLEPFHIETPKFKFDPCTGSADFRFGSFSHIKLSKYTEFLKKIPTAAAGYAVKMGIKTFCPQCETIMTDLERVTNEINSMMLDQCALSKSLGEGLISKLNASSQQKCMMQSNISGGTRDMYENMDECNKNSEKYGNSGEEQMKSTLGNEFNLAWKALSKNGSDTSNSEMLELMMSISGTLVGKKDNEGKWKFINYASLFSDSKQIENFIGNSSSTKVDLYSCNEKTKCLNISRTSKILNDTLYKNIQTNISSITKKIIDNKDASTLTEDEKTLVSFSTIPIISLIEQDLILKGINSDVLVSNSELIEVICYDVVSNYLTSLLLATQKEIKALELGSNEPDIINNFYSSIEDTRRVINSHKMTAYSRATIILQGKEQMTQKMNMIRNRFSRSLAVNR